MKCAKFLIYLLLIAHLSLAAKERADYVVVGVGTAGATMARLLSDDPNTSVIALHNGKDLSQNPDIKYTRNVLFTVASSLFGSPFYKTGFTVPQPNANNRAIFWAMGVPEGGDSAINAGAWAVGTNQVYAQWEALAGPEWSTGIIVGIYQSLEKYVGNTSNPASRGFNGPLEIRQNPSPTPLGIKFAEAISTATGVPIILDYNDPLTPIGACTQMQYTQTGSRGQFRESSATAFLNRSIVTRSGKGVSGRKLKIKFKSTALKTIWKGNKAIGVEYFKNGKIKKVYANKGVIVTGGLFSSAFLLHSGVGPQAVLKPLGIKVKFDNPNVGQSLADQMLSIIVFATNPNDTPISSQNSCAGQSLPSNIEITAADIISLATLAIPNADKQQLFTSILCDGFAFPGNSIFGTIANLPAPSGTPIGRQVRLTTSNPIPGIAVGLFDLVQPQSRGCISIGSTNPLDPPILNSGLFSNPADLDLYVQAFQIYLKNINAALHAIDPNYQLLFPPAELLDDINLTTEFVKEIAGSNQCFQSHCRMAPLNQGGVVDGFGQVYGVQNLFVADDSIVPVAVDGTPMASAYLIAANIARLLLLQ